MKTNLLHIFHRNNPHPARGRKPFQYPHTTIHYETTHTPQGDGNAARIKRSMRRKKQPTPRKGTETLDHWNMCGPCHETTHTPQGDGNSSTVRYGMQKRSETTHTPQGDGNTHLKVTFSSASGNNPHPARGRKTICVHIAEIVGETIHIPDRGQLTKKERETP